MSKSHALWLALSSLSRYLLKVNYFFQKLFQKTDLIKYGAAKSDYLVKVLEVH